MEAIFGRQKQPEPPPTPAPVAQTPVPTIDQAARSQDMSDKLRKRRGRLSTILVPEQFGAPAAGAKQQLGG